jgi:hypothetical protein
MHPWRECFSELSFKKHVLSFMFCTKIKKCSSFSRNRLWMIRTVIVPPIYHAAYVRYHVCVTHATYVVTRPCVSHLNARDDVYGNFIHEGLRLQSPINPL